MKLYYVRADNDNGENSDAYVRADTPVQAAAFCAAYWKGACGYEQETLWVDEVPSIHGFGGVIDWNVIVRHKI